MGPTGAEPSLFRHAGCLRDFDFCKEFDFNSPLESWMPVLRPRSRSISVRLSEEELAALREVCRATGARSISDLARKAMQEILEREVRQNAFDSKETAHSVQIRILERKVEELATELAMFKIRAGKHG